MFFRSFSIAVAVAGFSLPIAAQSRSGPSFDCALAKTPVEMAICNSDELSALDRELADVYRKLASRLAPDAAVRLRDEQRQWLRARPAACDLLKEPEENNVGRTGRCLRKGYVDRIETFSRPNPPAPTFAASGRPLPVLMTLTTNQLPDLCSAALAVADIDYRAGHEKPLVEGVARWSMPVRWLPWVQLAEPESGFGRRWPGLIPGDGPDRRRLLAMVELGEGAGPPVIVYEQTPFKWNGDSRGLFLAKSKDDYLLQFSTANIPSPKPIFGGDTIFELNVPNDWYVFQWTGRHFVLKSSLDERDTLNSPVRIHELLPGGGTSLVCAISPPADVLEPPKLAGLLKTINAIGQSLPCRKESDDEYWEGGASAAAVRSINESVLRWPGNPETARQFDKHMHVSTPFRVDHPSFTNFHHVLALLTQSDTAAILLAGRYQSYFGLDQTTAETIAAVDIDRFRAVYFPGAAVPATGAHAWHPALREMLENPNISAKARAAVLNASASPKELGVVAGLLIREWENRKEVAADWLPLLLDHPGLLAAALDKKTPAETRDAYGKTPLMYAAQFDLAPAVRLLLANGANPRSWIARPYSNDTCHRTVVDLGEADLPGGRNALLYAAEYAGEETISLLLAAQTPPEAAESRMAAQLMDGNDKLSPEARARLKSLAGIP